MAKLVASLKRPSDRHLALALLSSAATATASVSRVSFLPLQALRPSAAGRRLTLTQWGNYRCQTHCQRRNQCQRIPGTRLRRRIIIQPTSLHLYIILSFLLHRLGTESPFGKLPRRPRLRLLCENIIECLPFCSSFTADLASA
jgi:hypothetical protein